MGLIKWITEEIEDGIDFVADTADDITGFDGDRRSRRKKNRRE